MYIWRKKGQVASGIFGPVYPTLDIHYSYQIFKTSHLYYKIDNSCNRISLIEEQCSASILFPLCPLSVTLPLIRITAYIRLPNGLPNCKSAITCNSLSSYRCGGEEGSQVKGRRANCFYLQMINPISVYELPLLWQLCHLAMSGTPSSKETIDERR